MVQGEERKYMSFYAFFKKQFKSMLKYDNLIATIVVSLFIILFSNKIQGSKLFLSNKTFFYCIFQTFLSFFIIFGNCYSSFLEERLDKKTDITYFYANSFKPIIQGISLGICICSLFFSFAFTFLLKLSFVDYNITLISYSIKELLYGLVILPILLFIFSEIEGLFVFYSVNPKTSEMYVNFAIGLLLILIVFLSLFAYGLYEKHLLNDIVLIAIFIIFIFFIELVISKKSDKLKKKEPEYFYVIE